MNGKAYFLVGEKAEEGQKKKNTLVKTRGTAPNETFTCLNEIKKIITKQ